MAFVLSTVYTKLPYFLRSSFLPLPSFTCHPYSILSLQQRRLSLRLCHALDANDDGPTVNVSNAAANTVHPTDATDISSKEWPIMKRVCDRLFPKGTMDWEEFWMNDDFDDWFDLWQQCLKEEGGLDPSIPQFNVTQLGQREWLVRATHYLKTREDYSEMLPFDWTMASEETKTNYAKEFDPDWDDWDFRAMMEKRWAREKSRGEWRRKQKDVGSDVHIDTMSIDARIPEEARKEYQWTDEEVWDIITQKGRAADPRKIKKKSWIELDPDEMPDWAAQGNEYVEEIDEYLKKEKLMIDDEAILKRTPAEIKLESELKDIDSLFEDCDYDQIQFNKDGK